jgi:hypothetical protein
MLDCKEQRRLSIPISKIQQISFEIRSCQYFIEFLLIVPNNSEMKIIIALAVFETRIVSEEHLEVFLELTLEIRLSS